MERTGDPLLSGPVELGEDHQTWPIDIVSIGDPGTGAGKTHYSNQ
jgi:hypothetical protein